MEFLELEEADYNEVDALKRLFRENKKRLDKAEKQIISGGTDILMMLDGKSLQKTMEDVKTLTDELDKLRTEVEPALMNKLKQKYGAGRLEPYTMQWIKE